MHTCAASSAVRVERSEAATLSPESGTLASIARARTSAGCATPAFPCILRLDVETAARAVEAAGFSTTMVVGFSKIGAARDNHKPQTTTTQPRKRAGHSTLHTTIQPQPQTTQPQKWDIFDLNSADYKTRMRTAALHLAHPPTQCTS